MSQETKNKLEIALLALSIGAIVVTAAKSFILLPDRLNSIEAAQAEARVEQKSLVQQRQADNAMLQRIDERTAQMMRDIQELKKR